jgi:uncharacterized protein (TIGR03437 family)
MKVPSMRYIAIAGCLLLLGACTRPRNTSKLLPPVPAVQSGVADHDTDGGDASPLDALHYYLLKRLPEGATEISPDWFVEAQRHIALMPRLRLASEPAAAGLSWTQLGPGNIGGRTRSLLINPQNTNIMYAGAVTGGIWKTVDGGLNWSLLTDPSANITVGYMVMDPTNPNVIYAGTGESYQGYLGQGIYKSTDGSTFNFLPATSSFTYVNRLAIGHSNPQHIYAATSTGLWASMDGGTTWKQQLTVSIHGCDDVQARTDQGTDYMFASCGGKTSSAGYIVYRNTDAGGAGTWAQVLSNPAMARTSLAIAPSQQSTVYAISASNGTDNPRYKDGLQAVYRSQSNGDSGSWVTQTSNADPVVINTSVLSAPLCSATQVPYEYAWYANLAIVDPTNPNRLWAGATHIYRSDDGGANWNVAALTGSHVDDHIFLFHPGYNGGSNQTIYLGNDGGLFRSDNAAVALASAVGVCNPNDNLSWNSFDHYPMTWNSLNHSYAATQFYDATAFAGGGAYFGGTQDNGVIRGNDSTGLNGWTTIYGGDGGFAAIDPADASTLYVDNNSMSFHKSTNGGVTTPLAMNGIPSKETGLFIVPFAVDPNDGTKVWLAAQSALYRTVDGAANWTVAAPQPSGASYDVSAVAVSPFDSNTVVFGATDGNIYHSSSALSTDGSTPWASSQPRATMVSWIAFDPNDRGVVYAVYSGYRKGNPNVSHVYKSTDGGVTWNGIDGTGSTALPDIPIHTIIVDPTNSSTLYVGSDTGIFITQDGGNTWAHDPSAFADAVVDSLKLDRPLGGSVLFAFTFGRGAWKTPLANAPTGCTYFASPTNIAAPPVGGLYAVAVTTGSGCSWVVVPSGSNAFAGGEAPASGTGSKNAVVSVIPNFTGSPRSSTLLVAGTSVAVSQDADTLTSEGSGPDHDGNDEYAGLTPRTLPYTGLAYKTMTLTSNASDPVHSCSPNQSADYKTAWWLFTAPSTGMMEITVQSERWDSPGGNAGFVLTAYPSGNTNSELGCTTVPRDTSSWVYGKIRFAVTAGANYLAEVSAIGNTTNDGGYTLLFAAMGPPDFNLSVSPSAAQVISGSSLLFSATDTASLNPAVRWSIDPALGVISPSGLYTAPLGITAATSVTVTATAFADTRKRASVTLTVNAAPPPTISAVQNGASFLPGFSQGSWITIKGTNLAGTTRIWTGADFAGPNLPTQLDGASVTVDGKPAYVYYISPTQLNVLAPADAAQGLVQVQATYAGLTSTLTSAVESDFSPALFMFGPLGQKYVAAVRSDGQYIGPANLYPGLTVPAQAGNVIELYGTGFGPTNPPTNFGQTFSDAPPTTNTVTCTIGGVPATVQFAGLVVPGEYQLNIAVPPGLPPGDNLVVLKVMGITTQANAYLAVQ